MTLAARPPSSRVVTMVIASSVLAACNPPASQPPPIRTNAAGGNGGQAFAMECPNGNAVLTGITGRASWYIDRVQLVCSLVDGSGNWIGNGAPVGEIAGGAGGSEFTLRCPPNHAVKSIEGRADQYIDQLRVNCSELAAASVVGAPTSFDGPEGGNVPLSGPGGDPFGPLECPNVLPARGLYGNAQNYVDRIGLICSLAVFQEQLGSGPGSEPVPPPPADPTLSFRTTGLCEPLVLHDAETKQVSVRLSPRPSTAVLVDVTSENTAVASVAPAQLNFLPSETGNLQFDLRGAGRGPVKVAVQANSNQTVDPDTLDVLVIDLTKPVLIDPVDGASLPAGHVTFEWQQSQDAWAYRIVVEERRDDGTWIGFHTVDEWETGNSSESGVAMINLTMPYPGEYRWSVLALGECASPNLQPISDLSTFTIQ